MTVPSKVKDRTNEKYGKLTAVRYIGHEGNKLSLWLCRCECGIEVKVRGASLESGNTTSCGCYNVEVNQNIFNQRREEMNGKIFGRLKVIKAVQGDFGTSTCTHYLCLCDCGNEKVVSGNSLSSGKTKSCGCYTKEVRSTAKTIHDLSSHELYATWNNMLARCYNPNSVGYRNYGGRGISVCDSWRNSVSEFISWSMNNGYKPYLTLDRYPDNNGNYEPGNCRWATAAQQAQNSRNTKLTLEKVRDIRNDTRTQIEISRDYGISQRHVSDIILNEVWKDIDSSS